MSNLNSIAMTDALAAALSTVTVESKSTAGSAAPIESKSTAGSAAPIESKSATSKFMLGKNATATDFEFARNSIYKLGIKTSYDTSRMIFSSLHTHKNNLANAYVQECNGLILELGTWRPLMVPPRSLRFNINTNASNKFLHQNKYQIYSAEDGTCVNLYYYNNKWCISTARGYEMNDLKWESETYQNLLIECLESINLDWNSFTNQLDTKHCYSFGFRHKNFHRFRPENRMWFIQSVNLDSDSDQYMSCSDSFVIDSIQCQTLHVGDVTSLKVLYRLASNALDTYIENTNMSPCFGFILRSIAPGTTGAHSDLFIESSLMRKIRQTWYANQRNKECINNNWCKEDAVTLNAYLNSRQSETFLHLFPQYQARFKYYNQLIVTLVNKMIDSTDETSELISLTASAMLDNFVSNTKYQLSDKTLEQKTRVLMEYIVHESSIDILMPLL